MRRMSPYPTRRITMKYLLVALMTVSFAMCAAEAAAQPALITNCGLISAPGSYRLANNLSATGPGICLQARANSVTIDLDGFTIGGDGTGTGVGSGPIFTGVTVRNGTITRFSIGINFEDNNTPMVERVTFLNNSGDGVRANNTAVVKDSVFLFNGAGIRLEPTGAL